MKNFTISYQVKFIYENSDKILVSSNGFINSIEDKGVNRDKIEFFPQWAEPIFKPTRSKKYLLKGVPENSFKIMFAGNIGEAQDFSSILVANLKRLSSVSSDLPNAAKASTFPSSLLGRKSIA